MKVLIFASALAVLATASPVTLFRNKRGSQNEFKMCVPDLYIEDCKQMFIKETKSQVKITCVPARDRMDCLEKIHEHKADFVAVDPEDMYVAANYPKQEWDVFQEIRTKEEPNAEFRYEAVAVVHSNENINSIKDLKGLRSCHTGVGRNVGYKIPLTKLRNMHMIGGLNDTSMTPRENELQALSTLFSKACIVGRWSDDPDTNKRLKKKYSNLCALCEHPEICDYPDKFSGYDGALRCLAHNGGQIAWTKVIYVKKFFGLPVGSSPPQQSNEDPSQFSYLCPDGVKIPITEEPCRWAARPWQGFMASHDIINNINDLKKKIKNLNTIGETDNARWLQSVLTVDNKSLIINTKPTPPKQYLDKANYTEVIEREYGPPIKTVRICVIFDIEYEKCMLFSKAAFSRDIRPRFECVRQPTDPDCWKAIRDGVCDIWNMDETGVAEVENKFNLRPILSEEKKSGGKRYNVAIVKKNSSIRNLKDLRGKAACIGSYRSYGGHLVPLYTLIKAGLIKKSSCPYDRAFTDFFSGGICAPGINLAEFDIDEDIKEKMCSICAGDSDNNIGNPKVDKCHIGEAYDAGAGAFRCVAEGAGDVAFADHLTVSENTDKQNKLKWAIDLKSEDYELLCPKGGRAPIYRYEECYWSKLPKKVIVTSNSKSDQEIEELRHVLVTASKLFSSRPDIFRMFGSFKGQQYLMFSDTTSALVSFNQTLDKEFKKILTETSC